MSILEAFNAAIDHYTNKFPRWLNLILACWMLVAAAIYFGLFDLPDVGWWGLLIGAPMILLILALILQMVVLLFSWVTSPAKWLLRTWRGKH